MTEHTDFYTQLHTHTAIIRISGEDAESFLQGQTTCDIRDLKPQQTRLGAICNPKGRAITTFRLLRWADAYWMLLPLDLADSIFKRLKMFVLRSKVKVERAESFAVIGMSGSACSSIDPELESTPSGQFVTHQTNCLIKVSEQPCRAIWIGPGETVDDLLDALKSQQLPELNDLAWRRGDIESGIPNLSATTQELFVPQMLNLDLLGGISFNKGCYTGQEIVARMHYLGQLKQRMFLFKADADCPAGSRLIFETDPDHTQGTVVDCQAHPADGYVLLAVCRLDSQSDSPLFCENSSTFIERAELPYAIPSAS